MESLVKSSGYKRTSEAGGTVEREVSRPRSHQRSVQAALTLSHNNHPSVKAASTTDVGGLVHEVNT